MNGTTARHTARALSAGTFYRRAARPGVGSAGTHLGMGKPNSAPTRRTSSRCRTVPSGDISDCWSKSSYGPPTASKSSAHSKISPCSIGDTHVPLGISASTAAATLSEPVVGRGAAWTNDRCGMRTYTGYSIRTRRGARLMARRARRTAGMELGSGGPVRRRVAVFSPGRARTPSPPAPMLGRRSRREGKREASGGRDATACGVAVRCPPKTPRDSRAGQCSRMTPR
jgi:hypothetical protein